MHLDWWHRPVCTLKVANEALFGLLFPDLCLEVIYSWYVFIMSNPPQKCTVNFGIVRSLDLYWTSTGRNNDHLLRFRTLWSWYDTRDSLWWLWIDNWLVTNETDSKMWIKLEMQGSYGSHSIPSSRVDMWRLRCLRVLNILAMSVWEPMKNRKRSTYRQNRMHANDSKVMKLRRNCKVERSPILNF